MQWSQSIAATDIRTNTSVQQSRNYNTLTQNIRRNRNGNWSTHHDLIPTLPTQNTSYEDVATFAHDNAIHMHSAPTQPSIPPRSVNEQKSMYLHGLGGWRPLL